MSAGSTREMVFIYSVFRQRAAMITRSAWDWIYYYGAFQMVMIVAN